MSERRKFTREFKLAAVRKVLDQGLTFTEVARDLGISDVLLHNWRKTLQEDGTLKARKDESSSTEAELKRLREEVRQLKMERDILKKATAFFAKDAR